MAFRVQIRRDPSGKWIVNNPILLSGEFGYETDTAYMKIGDGATPWNYLPYWSGPREEYKIYSAIITQTGDYTSLTPGPNFIIGQRYFVQALYGSDNFTNIGFVSTNSPFIATGTTPTRWLDNSQVRVINSSVFPTFNVLENTLGIELTSDANDSNAFSSFKLISNLPVFLENKTIIYPYGFGGVDNVPQDRGVFRLNDTTLILGAINPLGAYKPYPLEIKVYN